MYDARIDNVNYNITIGGVDLIMEEPTVNEAYNRRDTSRHSIIGGTQHVIRTEYKVRDYSFKTHLRIDPLYPDIYNDMFKEWMSKSTEVISAYMGGKFDAEIIVKPVPKGNYLEVDIQVIEIPTSVSTINHESIDAPSDKHLEITSKKDIDELKKSAKNIEKKIKELEKKTKSKKNTNELKKLKDKLKDIKKKINEKSKTTKSSTKSSKKTNKSNKKSSITNTKKNK